MECCFVSGSGDLFRKFSIESNKRATGDLELTIRSWLRYLRSWKNELASDGSWRERRRAWPLGFRVATYRLLELDRRDHTLYVPDFPLPRPATRMNGFWNPIIGNKLVLSYVAQAAGVPCPALLGALVHGRPYSFDGTPADDLAAALEQWTQTARRLVFRPHWSGAAEGVFFVDRESGQWRINDQPASITELTTLLRALHRYLVTEWVEQATFARRIYSRTPNTLRVLMLRDADGPFVAAAVHRFGSSRSFPVDNFHAGRGGLGAPVDMATGRLGAALGADANGRMMPFTHHPETNERIEGVDIPHYHAAIDGMRRLCHALPEGVWVGWDALMTDDGYRILEGNSPPGLHVWQVHEPLLRNARVARFFAAHGVGRT